MTRDPTNEDPRGPRGVGRSERPSETVEQSEPEVALDGGWQTAVHRRGNTVLRTSGPQSPTVMRLLHHLDANGFSAAPRPIGNGFEPDGREALTYLDGTSPHPGPWTDDAAWQIGDLLRSLHAAGRGFDPGPDPQWRLWFARSLGGHHPVIGHGDLGPWNILAVDDSPVGFIDWDNAGPVDAHWELAQVVWLNAQLHDDDVAELNDLAEPAARIRQAAVILDGYQFPRADRSGLVDTMIEFAIRSTRAEAIDRAVAPETTSPAADGFPTLWALTWRIRAAAWMLDNRQAIEAQFTRAR